MHSSFLLVHLLFLIIAFENWEQKITFPIKYQTTISLIATVVTMGLGTVCSHVLDLSLFTKDLIDILFNFAVLHTKIGSGPETLVCSSFDSSS